jgi:hypothetical protein
MKIFIDESGSFVGAQNAMANQDQIKNGWNVIAALTVPEESLALLENLIESLRQKFSNTGEIKFEHIRKDEAAYCNFLNDLKRLGIKAFYIAYNDSVNIRPDIESSKQDYLDGIQDRIDLIENEYTAICGRKDAEEITQDIAKNLISENRRRFGEWNRYKGYMQKLSIPLFVQMRMQVSLTARLLDRAINEYALEYPDCLSEFEWIFDTKNNLPYERSYILCAMNTIQYEGWHKPFVRIPGGDYRALDRSFKMEDSLIFHERGQDLPLPPTCDAWNLERMLGDKFSFVDSRSSSGVQAADLVASGVACCLKANFKFNNICAGALGRLTLREITGYLDCIQFVNFGKVVFHDDLELYEIVNKFEKNAKIIGRN